MNGIFFVISNFPHLVLDTSGINTVLIRPVI